MRFPLFGHERMRGYFRGGISPVHVAVRIRSTRDVRPDFYTPPLKEPTPELLKTLKLLETLREQQT